MFLCGIIMVTDAGKYWVDIFDSYCCLIALHLICAMEVVSVLANAVPQPYSP